MKKFLKLSNLLVGSCAVLLTSSCDNQLINVQLNNQVLIPFLNYYMTQPDLGFKKTFKDLQNEIFKKLKTYQSKLIDTSTNEALIWNNIQDFNDITSSLQIVLYKIQNEENVIAEEINDWTKHNSKNLTIKIFFSTLDDEDRPFKYNLEYPLSVLNVPTGIEFNEEQFVKKLQSTKLQIIPQKKDNVQIIKLPTEKKAPDIEIKIKVMHDDCEYWSSNEPLNTIFPNSFKTKNHYSIELLNLNHGKNKYIIFKNKNSTEIILYTLNFKKSITITGYKSINLVTFGKTELLEIIHSNINNTTLSTLDLETQLLKTTDFQHIKTIKEKTIFKQDDKIYHETLKAINFENDNNEKILKIITKNITNKIVYNKNSKIGDYFLLDYSNYIQMNNKRTWVSAFFINKNWTKFYYLHWGRLILKDDDLSLNTLFYIQKNGELYLTNKNYEKMFLLKDKFNRNVFKNDEWIEKQTNYIQVNYNTSAGNKVELILNNSLDQLKFDQSRVKVTTYDYNTWTYWTFIKDKKHWLANSENLSKPIEITDNTVIKEKEYGINKFLEITNNGKIVLYTLDLKHNVNVTQYQYYDSLDINNIKFILLKHQTKNRYLLFDENLEQYPYSNEKDNLFNIVYNDKNIYYFKTNTPYKYNLELTDYKYLPTPPLILKHFNFSINLLKQLSLMMINEKSFKILK